MFERHIIVFSFLVACSATAETLVRADVAAALRAEDCPSPRAFDFTGTALEDTGWVTCFHDGTAGIKVENHTPPGTTWREGDRIRIRGELELNPDDQAFFRVRRLDVLAHGTLPPPIDASGEDIVRGKFNYRFARVRGVISSVSRDELSRLNGWITLRTDTEPILASFGAKGDAYERIRTLIDAEVELSGLVRPTSGWRRQLSNQMTFKPSSLRIIRPALSNPFAAPRFTDWKSRHRQRIDGTVSAVASGRFFITTATGRFIAIYPAEGTSFPPQGASVTVVGFAEMDPYRLEFKEALVKCSPPGRPRKEAPIPVEPENLFINPDGVHLIDTSLRGKLISFTARIHDKVTDGKGSDTLLLAANGRTIQADVSAMASGDSRPLEIGSTVRITGYLVPEFEAFGPNMIFPRFRHFTVIPRTAADIRVLSRPPWWTPLRLFVVILVLVAVLAAILVWIVMLNRKSERRGRELYEERAGHAIAEQKVEERTRLAVELHDSISQTLTGVALQMDAASQIADRGGSPSPILATARQMLTSCREELRRCLWDLRSRTFEEKNMTEAVERTIAPHTADAEVTVRFNVPREKLSESTTHTILRIIRELVVNAIRHGQADQIRIAGEYHDGLVSFSVRDNGRGFDPATAPGPEQGHFGLLGIRERLDEFNGTLTIESESGNGSRISAMLNAEKDQDEQ